MSLPNTLLFWEAIFDLIEFTGINTYNRTYTHIVKIIISSLMLSLNCSEYVLGVVSLTRTELQVLGSLINLYEVVIY